MKIIRVFVIIMVCCPMCYAQEIMDDAQIVRSSEETLSSTNSAKYGVTVYVSKAFHQESYCLNIVFQDSIKEQKTFLSDFAKSVFRVELAADEKPLILNVPVHYSVENGYCHVEFSMSQHLIDISKLHIYYGCDIWYTKVSLLLKEWFKYPLNLTQNNTQL